MSKADDEVQEILAETRRRKGLWQKVMATASDAYAAVNREAKRRGAPDRIWLDLAQLDPRRTSHLFYCGHTDVQLTITAKGKVTVELKKSFLDDADLYEGWTYITDAAVKEFAQEAVKDLMHRLLEYEKSQRKTGKKKP